MCVCGGKYRAFIKDQENCERRLKRRKNSEPGRKDDDGDKRFFFFSSGLAGCWWCDKLRNVGVR